MSTTNTSAAGCYGHIRFLYCLHALTFLCLAIGFLYLHLLSPSCCWRSNRNDRQPISSSAGITRGFRSSSSLRSTVTSKRQQQQQTRSKRHTVIPTNKVERNEDHFYEYSLNELLEIEKRKQVDQVRKSDRKRLKLRIMFNKTAGGGGGEDNDSDRVRLSSSLAEPTILTLPSSSTTNSDVPPIVLPIDCKIQMNDLKDFCFSLNDFCEYRKDQPPKESATGGINENIQTNVVSHQVVSNETTSDETENKNSTTTKNTISVEEDSFDADATSLNTTTTTNITYDLQSSAGYSKVVSLSTKTKKKEWKSKSKSKRKRCYIDKIGKGLMVAQRKTFYGAWMKDARPRFELDSDKRWVTEHFSGILLQEYADEGDLQQSDQNPVKTYQLPHMYDGTNHVMYNGSLYYHRASTANILRYDLYSNTSREVTVKGAAHSSDQYLYGDNKDSYFDLAVDENGLWVFYRFQGETFLSVSRIHPQKMQIMKTWNLTEIDSRTVGNAWIACGIVYTVKSSKLKESSLFVAHDLYKKRYAELEGIKWSNPFSNANMITYNPLDRKIYTYDNGHLIVIPVLLIFDID